MRRTTLRLFTAIFLILPLAANAQDWAKARLEASPRHREYVPIKHGDRTVQTFVVYPEVKQKVPVVILIHEIFGLSDWAKSMADDLAAAGFIVVAPDLLSGSGANNGGTDSFASMDAITKAVSGLNPDQVTADLDAVADYAKKIPAGNGKIATVGFCWGGGKSFAFATHRHDLSAAFVFYGPGPADVSTITTIFGFYAGNDARIGATLTATVSHETTGKQLQPVAYDGAGHGFMRAGVDPGNTVPGNKTAREEGFTRLVSLLKDMKSASIPTTGNKSLAKRSSTTKSTPSCHDTTKTAAM